CAKVRTSLVLGAVRGVDAFVDSSLDLLERDFLRHARGGDLACLLTECSLVPPGRRSVVRVHVEGAVEYDGPDPGQRPVGDTVVPERCDMEVVGLRDLVEFLLGPGRRHGIAPGLVASESGVASIRVRDLTRASVVARNFLKCGVWRCV